jgi:hypothetical protein
MGSYMKDAILEHCDNLTVTVIQRSIHHGSDPLRKDMANDIGPGQQSVYLI